MKGQYFLKLEEDKVLPGGGRRLASDLYDMETQRKVEGVRLVSEYGEHVPGGGTKYYEIDGQAFATMDEVLEKTGGQDGRVS